MLLASLLIAAHALVASADSGSDVPYLDVTSLHFKRADAVPLRIMPVGASVTFGVGSTTGDSYRKDLLDLLKAQGTTAEMVGSRKNGKDLANNQVEATSGFVISQIAKSVKKATPQFMPNLVLLDAGTNNCNKGGDVPDAGTSVAAMIDEVYKDSPGSTVVLATVLATKDAAQDKCRVGINTQYQVLATDMAAKKAKFVLVDMRSADGPTTADLSDSRHPNDAGYAKMAKVWLKGIQEAQTKGFLTAPAAVAANTGSEKHNKGGKNQGGAAKNGTAPATGGKPKKGGQQGGAKNATQPATGNKGGQKGQPAKNATQPATGGNRGGNKGGQKGSTPGQKQNSTRGATPTNKTGGAKPTSPVKAGSSMAYELHAFVTAGMMGAAMYFML